MGFMAPDVEMPAVPAPEMPKPLPTAQQPQGSRTRRRTMSPTFLGGDTTPGAQNMGGKTLIGQ